MRGSLLGLVLLFYAFCVGSVSSVRGDELVLSSPPSASAALLPEITYGNPQVSLGYTDEKEIAAAVAFARRMLTTPRCQRAFRQRYSADYDLEFSFSQTEIYVIPIPEWVGTGVSGATLAGVAPRTMILDPFWMTLFNTDQRAGTIVHEFIHIMDHALQQNTRADAMIRGEDMESWTQRLEEGVAAVEHECVPTQYLGQNQ